MEITAGSTGWLAAYTGLPGAVGDEVDDALLGLRVPVRPRNVAVLA